MYETIIFIGNLLKGREIKSPVFISSKTRRPVNAALHEVLRDTCYVDSGLQGNNERSRNDIKSYVSI